MQNERRWVLALVVGLALSLEAGASGVPEKSLTEILSESRVVVHGRVIDQFSQWEEFDEHKIIYTYSTIHVERGQFGGLPEMRDVVVRTVGGTVDDYTQVLIDEASFTLGEEVIAFLTLEDGWAHLSVTNFRQGKYTVVRDSGGRIRGLLPDAGQQADAAATEQQRLVPFSRFATEFRDARLALSQGDKSGIHPLVPVR